MSKNAVIAIDGSRMTAMPRTGTENYSRQIISAMTPLVEPAELEIYLRPGAGQLDLPLPGPVTYLQARRLWTHYRLSAEIVRRRPEVLFVPSHVVPALHPKTVVTIHDLAFEHRPQDFPDHDRRYLYWSTRWSARTARVVIVPSNATRDDLVQLYGVPDEKISVVPHGVSFPALMTEQEREIRLKRLGLERPFILAVGTVAPRKNYCNLLAAFEILARNQPELSLIIAGANDGRDQEFNRRLADARFRDRVKLTGNISDTDLAALYRSASVFAQVSYFEGFGMPVLEAMSVGLPVVVSSTPALLEIAGDAALPADPGSPETIAAALDQILINPTLAHRHRNAGLKRAATYNWSSSAEATLAVLRSVRDNKR